MKNLKDTKQELIKSFIERFTVHGSPLASDIEFPLEPFDYENIARFFLKALDDYAKAVVLEEREKLKEAYMQHFYLEYKELGVFDAIETGDAEWEFGVMGQYKKLNKKREAIIKSLEENI